MYISAIYYKILKLIVHGGSAVFAEGVKTGTVITQKEITLEEISLDFTATSGCIN